MNDPEAVSESEDSADPKLWESMGVKNPPKEREQGNSGKIGRKFR